VGARPGQPGRESRESRSELARCDAVEQSWDLLWWNPARNIPMPSRPRGASLPMAIGATASRPPRAGGGRGDSTKCDHGRLTRRKRNFYGRSLKAGQTVPACEESKSKKRSLEGCSSRCGARRLNRSSDGEAAPLQRRGTVSVWSSPLGNSNCALSPQRKVGWKFTKLARLVLVRRAVWAVPPSEAASREAMRRIASPIGRGECSCWPSKRRVCSTTASSEPNTCSQGLVREGEGVAAQVLVSMGSPLGPVRQKVIQITSG